MEHISFILAAFAFIFSSTVLVVTLPSGIAAWRRLRAEAPHWPEQRRRIEQDLAAQRAAIEKKRQAGER